MSAMPLPSQCRCYCCCCSSSSNSCCRRFSRPAARREEAITTTALPGTTEAACSHEEELLQSCKICETQHACSSLSRVSNNNSKSRNSSSETLSTAAAPQPPQIENKSLPVVSLVTPIGPLILCGKIRKRSLIISGLDFFFLKKKGLLSLREFTLE
jgi:hypothetical protein